MWLLGMRKLRSSKKVEILQVVLALRVVPWKKVIFITEERNCIFSLVFTMKLFSTALSYLTAHSTLNFPWTFLYLLYIITTKTSKK